MALIVTSASCEYPTNTRSDAGVRTDSPPGMFGDSSLALSMLTISRVDPDHGPFAGGATVVLRGTGFREGARTYFDGRPAEAASHRVFDRRRLETVAPAGEVGTVDVTVEIDGESYTLEDGYTYDSLSVSPRAGSIAGGTFVRIDGSATRFGDGDQVWFGAMPCRDVHVESATRLNCRTPPMPEGPIDVRVVSAVDSTAATAWAAFTAWNTTDPRLRVTSGGPIEGSIDVTVISAAGGRLPGAFAILGGDLATEHQGWTDVLGQITLSGADVVGPQTLHVTAPGFGRFTLVGFDAAQVTAILPPRYEPPPPLPDDFPTRPVGQFVEGELVWPTTADGGSGSWWNIPEPDEGWERVAYVLASGTDVESPGLDPSGRGAENRVSEWDVGSAVAPPYRILARTGPLAVYALAGLEDPSRTRFVPYVMGVTRHVRVEPERPTTSVDIEMDIPLDQVLDVRLGARPEALATGPDRHWVRCAIDLGADGLIPRRWGSHGQFDLDLVDTVDPSAELRFVAQPALVGGLAGARFRVEGGWYTTHYWHSPFSRSVLPAVQLTGEPAVLPDLLGLPEAVAPREGERIPLDRVLRWRPTSGGARADFHYVSVRSGDTGPAWVLLVPGHLHEAPIPDLSSIPGIEDLARGNIPWSVASIRVPGFDFGEFDRDYLDGAYPTHFALAYYTAVF